MTELIICLLPYIVILMGSIFFWHLLSGKQEAVKFVTTNSAIDDSDIEGRFFFGKLKGTSYIESPQTYADEQDFNQKANLSDEDEPVLPYDTEGGDMRRAFELSAYQVYFSTAAGGYRVGRTQTGWRMNQLGIGDNISGNTVYQDGDNIEVEITDNANLLGQISVALGSWIDYRSASANYSYASPLGSGKLPFESNAASSRQWRQTDGYKVFREPLDSFWAVITDSFMRDWDDDLNTLSAALADNFKTSSGDVNPASLNSSNIDSSLTDVSIIHSATE